VRDGADIAGAGHLPSYLHRPDLETETFGTLCREVLLAEGRAEWVVEGDPQMVLTAKRLFPGAAERGSGIARFPATKRVFRELVWFLHRWPLRPENPAAFEAAYAEACDHDAERRRAAVAPGEATPPPVFQGELWPFQKEGLAFALVNRRTLIADEMGLGKTLQALAWLSAVDAWPAVVVVPSHLVRHWMDKAEAFLGAQGAGLLATPSSLKLHVLRGLRPYDPPLAQVYVIHYGLLSAWRREIIAMRPGAVVLDEIQELRHTGTQKYSAASEIAADCENVLGLSGTPIYNRGGEIWSVVNILEFHALGDYESFTREWCGGYGVPTVSDPALLGTHLRREGLMIRRRKEDVIPDLPPKRRVVETLETAGGLFDRLVAEGRKLACLAADADDPLERGRLEREAVAQARKATGVAKAPAAAAFVAGLIEAEEPVIVFAHHHAVVDALTDAIGPGRVCRVTGREGQDQKAAAIKAFRDGVRDVCIVSLRAAAGLDGLQDRARVVVFAELDWSPAVHSQAEDWAHRMGQADSVLAYYPITEEGSDPEILDVLGLKVAQFVGLMGDRAETEADRTLAAQDTSAHMKRIVAKLRGAS